MRISSLNMHNQGLNQMTKNSQRVLESQQQVASGERLSSAADDPVASTRILALQQDTALRTQYQNNLNTAENSLQREEAALKGVVSSMQRIRELTVQAGDGSYSETDRQALADEIAVRLDELKDLMNTKGADGVYIFAGFQASEPPFSERTGGGFDYSGDEGQRMLQISSSTTVPLNDSGKTLFVDIPAVENTVLTSASSTNTAVPAAVVSTGQIIDQEAWDAFFPDNLVITFNDEAATAPAGPNYSIQTRTGGIELASNVPFQDGDLIDAEGMSLRIEGVPRPGDSFLADSSPKQDLLTTVRRLEDGLNSAANDDAGRALMASLVDETLQNLDAAMDSVLSVQSQIGGRLNVIETTRGLHEDVDILTERILSEIKYVDEAEAISTLTLQTYLLEAAQQSFITINNLSLFNKL